MELGGSYVFYNQMLLETVAFGICLLELSQQKLLSTTSARVWRAATSANLFERFVDFSGLKNWGRKQNQLGEYGKIVLQKFDTPTVQDGDMPNAAWDILLVPTYSIHASF